MLSWQILVSISAITYSLSSVLQRILMRDDQSDPYLYSIVFQLTVGGLIFVYTLFVGFSLPNLIAFLPNLVALTALYALGGIALFHTFKSVDAASASILTSTRSLWMLLGSALLLHEMVGINRLLGALLIIVGVILVSLEQKSLAFKPGIGYGLAAGMCYGLAFVNDAFMVRYMDVPSYMVICFLIPPLVLILLRPHTLKHLGDFSHANKLGRVMLLGLFYGTAAVTVFLSYQQGGEVSQVGPISQTQAVLTVFLGAFILKEKKLLLYKFLGAVATVGGVALLT